MREQESRMLERAARRVGLGQIREIVDAILLERVTRLEVEGTSIRRFTEWAQSLGLRVSLSKRSYVFESDTNMGCWASELHACASDHPSARRLAYVGRDSRSTRHAELADSRGDDSEIGRLLGYPDCCIESHLKWKARGESRDPVSLLVRVNEHRWQEHTCPNPFTRYVGLGWLSHYPCRLGCAATAALAERSRQAMEEHLPTVAADLMAYERSVVVYAEGSGIAIWKDFETVGGSISLDNATSKTLGLLEATIRGPKGLGAGRIQLRPAIAAVRSTFDLNGAVFAGTFNGPSHRLP